MARWWEVVDVTAWPVRGSETRGLRAKSWVADPANCLWLRKLPRSSRPSEPAVEVLALELAHRLGIDAAEARPCIFEADGEPVRGIVSRRFLSSREELWTGDVLLRRMEPHYDPQRHEFHTADRVLEALRRLEAVTAAGPLVDSMQRMLIFDAWIGNGDRHPQNWAIRFRTEVEAEDVSPTINTRLAPMFDPACCFGVELQDDHVLLRDPGIDRLQAYAARCPSGFGDGNRLIRMAQLVAAIRVWPGFQESLTDLVARFRHTLDTELSALVDEVPEDWLSPPRKHLACQLLRQRLDWLTNLGP